MNIYKHPVYWLCLALTGTVAIAADSSLVTDDTEAEPEPPQYYQIELIVFRHLDQSATTSEIPRTSEPEVTQFLEQELARLSGEELPTVATDQALPSPDPLAEPSAFPAAAEEIGLVEIEPEEIEQEPFPFLMPSNPEGLLLANTVTRIDEIEAYELLGYIHWAQQAPDVTVSEPLDLLELGADAEIIIGNIELHQRRHLHLAVDISLTDMDNMDESAYSSNSQSFSRPSASPELAGSRRVRLEKLQYFDQPKFGVLAIVSRFKLPEADELSETVSAEPEALL
jgi:hypothetical protein